MKADYLARLNQFRAERQPCALVTHLKDGTQRFLTLADMDHDPLHAELAQAFRLNKSAVVEREGEKYFITIQAPPLRIIVLGAVHVSQSMAGMARLFGYDLMVVDPRTAFASETRFPDTRVVAEWPDQALPALRLDAFTAFVALTHDPKIDDPGLELALKSPCFYIGALGSRKTHARRIERLQKVGFTEADLARIHAPIGLNIGGVSPAEIALSIMSEITATLRLPAKAERLAQQGG
jgi:xanthine dehydrogenase accessory factor